MDIKFSKKKQEEIFSGIVGMIILFLFLDNAIKVFCALDSIDIYLKIVISATIMITSPLILSRIKYKHLIWLFCSLIIIIGNILFFPQNNIFFYKTCTVFLPLCFTPMIIVSIIDSYDILYKKLYKISILIALICICTDIMVINGNIGLQIIEGYSMWLGYSCLIPIMILTNEFLKKIDIYNLIMILGVLFIIISFGSRGPLLSILIYFILLLKNKFKNITLFFIIILMISALVSLYYKEIIEIIVSVLDEFDIHSRTLFLLNNELNHSSGRTYLYNIALNEIANNPFLIRGINADYLLLGGYAHNFIIELSLEFGLVIGILCSILIIYYALLNIFNNNATDDLGILLLCASIIPLCFSSSLWINNTFWMWIGLQLNKKRKLQEQVAHFS